MSWHSTTSTSAGADAGFFVRIACREGRGRHDVGVVDSRERRGLAEHAAWQVRTQPRGRKRDAVGRRARRTTAAAPSFGEHSIQRCSGSHTTRDASTSSAVTSLRNIAFGLCTPCLRFFTTTSAKWSFVSPCSRSSRWARRAKYAGVAARPVSSRHGSKNDDRMMPFGIFSTPNTSTQSYCPAGSTPAAIWSTAPPLAQPASTSTIGTPVHRERTQHLVTRRHAAVRSPAECGLERRIARLGEHGTHRVHTHVGVRDAGGGPTDGCRRRRRLHERPRDGSVRERVGDELHRLTECQLSRGRLRTAGSRSAVAPWSIPRCRIRTAPALGHQGGAAVTAVQAHTVASHGEHNTFDIGCAAVWAPEV